MKVKEQVCSLDLARKLKELGAKQESLWYWWYDDPCGDPADPAYGHYGDWVLTAIDFKKTGRCYSAFTVAELGEILKDIDWPLPHRGQNAWYAYSESENTPDIEANTEANARAKMLIYLREKEGKR